MNREQSIEEIKNKLGELPTYILRKIASIIDEYMREKNACSENDNSSLVHSEN